MDISLLETFLKNNKVDIAVLALPKGNVAEVLPTLVQNEISGIWNFSHVDLKTPDSITVENVHLTDSLLTLSYKLSQREKGEI